MTEIVFSPIKSLTCVYCERAWPPEDEYHMCPACREPTEGSKFTVPIDAKEADRLAAHYKFGWYIWDTGQL